MSEIPPEIKLTTSLPTGGDDRNLQAMVDELLRRAAHQSGVIVNVFHNPGMVVIKDQSARIRGKKARIGGTEIMGEKTHIHATSSIVSYKSNLTNVEILLNADPGTQTPEESKLRLALKELAEMLSTIPQKHAEEAMLISQRLEELTKLVSKPAAARKQSILTMSAKGLKEAAEAVGDIVPGLIVTAGKIATSVAATFPA